MKMMAGCASSLCTDTAPLGVRQRATTAGEATQHFSRVIAALLALVFEAADVAAEPAVSRLLVALFNLMQGKELAGQERASGAAAFAAGGAASAGAGGEQAMPPEGPGRHSSRRAARQEEKAV